MTPWVQRDLPVLASLVESNEEGVLRPDSSWVAARLGIEHDAADRSVELLAEEGYISADWSAAGWRNIRVLPLAYREVGFWPAGSFDRERLLSSLDRLVDQATASERQAAASVRDGVAAFSAEGLRDLALAMIASGLMTWAQSP